MSNFQYRYSFISNCLVSVGVFFVFSWCFSSFFKYSFPKAGYSIPVSDLQRTLYTSIGNGDVGTAGFSGDRPSDVLNHISKAPRKLSTEQQLEQGLARARASITKAASSLNSTEFKTEIPNGEVFRNPALFYRSYMEMEKRFKVFVYEEGEPPLVHDGPCKDVYAIEGRFMQEIEKGETRFRTLDPTKAHVFLLPFSVTYMVKYVYERNERHIKGMKRFTSDYITQISRNYPFWNRTNGADHVMVACHDWGPMTSEANPFLFNTSIRLLCNANSSEGFNPRKDATLPEIKLYGADVHPKLYPSKVRHSPRRHLAFFAGGVHGPVRPILLEHWKQRDPDMPVYEYLPKDLSFYDFMTESKFCLCPSGYEVASPRVIESIYAECIPVILSYNFVLPYTDVLRWETFSIQVNVSEIPRLKEILMSVSEEKYRWLRRNLRDVRRYFELNQPPKRFDAFHMILHSVWLRRLNMGLT